MKNNIGGAVTGASLIETLSDPRSVAIIGISTRKSSYSNRALRYLHDFGYEGEIRLVSPNHKTINGLACSPEIKWKSLDVAFVAVPAANTLETCADLAASGTKVAIVIAADMTVADRRELHNIAKQSGMRIIGPNCVGALSTEHNAFLTFSSVLRQRRPKAGSIAVVTQSGAVGNALMLSILRRGAGISHLISTGDEVDTGSLELIEGLLYDDHVATVGVFIEGLTDTEWLDRIRLASAASGKSVHILKGAQSLEGRSAAAGHTGRVVGPGETTVAVLRNAGIVVHSTMAEMVDVLVASDVLKNIPGPRVGIVSISGGSGVLAADAVSKSRNLQLANLKEDPALEDKLGGRVHVLANPIDVAASSTDIFCDWATSMVSGPSCDIVIAIETSIIHDRTVLVERLAQYAGPGVIALVPFSEDDRLDEQSVATLANAGIVTMPTAERAIKAFNTLRATSLDTPVSGTTSHDVGSSNEEELPRRGVGGLEKSVQLLGDDLPWAEYAVVDKVDEARAAAHHLGFPVVVKAAGRTILHRSETDAVAVGVFADQLESVFSRIERTSRESGDLVVVQAQVAHGFELLVSATNHAELGAVVYVRFGGTLAELMEGSATIWHGWSSAIRRTVLETSLLGPILLGYRGAKPYDVSALCSLIDRLLDRVNSGTVMFAELNPVIIYEQGLRLVDAFVVESTSY